MLAAYNEIKQLIYQYAKLIDEGSLEAVAQLFENGQISTSSSGQVFSGKDAVLALYQSSTRIYPDNNTPHTQHVVSNPIIDIDGSGRHATGNSCFTVYQQVDQFPLQVIIAGRYYDEFQLIDAVWQFKERKILPTLFGDLSHHLLINPEDIQ